MVCSVACSAKERKSDTVRRLTRSGEYKKALRIAKGFRLGITREQSDKMGIAYECRAKLLTPLGTRWASSSTKKSMMA